MNDFNRNNNFNLLRIYLSLSVVLFHCYELSRQPPLAFVNRFFNGDTAVRAFFIISGYLVMKSYMRSRSLKEFWLKRFYRIYPAYFTVIILCGIFGWMASTYPVRIYFSSIELYRYLIANLALLNFIQPTLPGVFGDNAFTAVNGALWTIKVEVGYYLLVPAVYFIAQKINRQVFYFFLILGSLGFHLLMLFKYQESGNQIFLFLSRQIPGYLFYFIAGAWVIEFESKPWFRLLTRWLCIPALVLLTLPLHIALQCLCLVVAVFSIAYRIPVIKYPFRQEDFSYGLYIYHFPVIQCLIDRKVFATSPAAGLIWSVLITLALALFSWIWIEKPFISKTFRQKFAVN